MTELQKMGAAAKEAAAAGRNPETEAAAESGKEPVKEPGKDTGTDTGRGAESAAVDQRGTSEPAAARETE